MTPSDPRDASPAAADDPRVGTTIGEDYEVLARIGEGASATVYRVRHRLLDQEFALKVLAPHLAGEAEVRRRFLLEARTLTKFTHRSVAQVRGCGEDGGALYLVVDLCAGESFDALLAREGPLPEERAVHLTLAILDALGEAHRAGIVHRDLKPSNVMVEAGPDGDHVRVLDFGLARWVDAERGAMPSAFASLGGAVVGTVAYMSPEQLRAEDDVDGRSDLFAAGVVLYEALSGVLPFDAKSTLGLAMSILENEPREMPPERLARTSPEVRAVVLRALEKDRDRRFATAEEFAEALRDARAGTAPTALPPPRSATPATRTGRRRVVLAAGAIAVLAAIALAVAQGGPRGESARDADRAMARAALDAGRWREAAEALGRLESRGEATGEDVLARARALVTLGDRNAPAALDRAAGILGRDPRVALERARAAWRLANDFGAAEGLYASVLLSDANDADARAGRAQMRLARARADAAAGRAKEALEGLEAAERDAAVVEEKARADGRGPWLRGSVALVRADLAEDDDAARTAARESAVAAGRAATRRDADLAAGYALVADAIAGLAWRARLAGRHADAKRLYGESLEASARAIERAGAVPAHHEQGLSLWRYLVERGSTLQQVERFEESAADFEAALRLRPDDLDLLKTMANLYVQVGRFEEARRVAERILAVVEDAPTYFHLAFGFQRDAVARAEQGDLAGALERDAIAVSTYAHGATRFPSEAQFHHYAAETWVHRARFVRGDEREAALAAAGKEFAASEPLASPSERAELLYRRAEWHAVRGESDEAVADARAAIGDDPTKGPAFHARLCRTLLVAARAPGLSDAARVDRLDEAIRAATNAHERSGRRSATALVLRAVARARRAATPPPPDAADGLAAARADLAAAPGAVDEAGELPRVETAIAFARAEIERAAGDAAAAVATLRTVVDARQREAVAGRWYEDPEWRERLADHLEASGRADDAALERAHARELR